jgi:hypothetical protein
LNNKEKVQDEACFQILRPLHENPELNQRELGEPAGFSLGAVNCGSSSLVDLALR